MTFDQANNKPTKVIVNGVEEKPSGKFKAHEVMTQDEINALIVEKQNLKRGD